jgi:nicotinamidase-related amidase
MALDLTELVDPRHTAVLTMELQRGVVGDLASMPDLRDVVAADEVVAHTAQLLAAARSVGARVVHCTAVFRPGLAGSPINTPFAAARRENLDKLAIGSPEAALIPELGAEPSDLESTRMHGMAPFIGTNLDPTLRAEGIRTVVATGVSVNVGIFGLTLEAVNFGYRVVVARDCVAGLPAEYVESVLKHSLAVLATVRTSREIVDAWGS